LLIDVELWADNDFKPIVIRHNLALRKSLELSHLARRDSLAGVMLDCSDIARTVGEHFGAVRVIIAVH
jgi:hypothetical protein